ncbi:MAG TPA: PilZ domain-containing protein [Gemmataceae bacterium]|nr:PilZ domain-containing protein [Gemmataceae bacterium]
MFERTFSFWRRLVGRPSKPMDDSAHDLEDDRRIWVRYPADLETTYQPATRTSIRLSARVRDISRGGVQLVVNRDFQTGELLSIELPRANQETHTVLACIVRVDRASGDAWSVGCVFSRELGDDELEGFGARRVRHAESDQRLWMRFPCNVKATYQKVATPEALPQGARVLDISATGVGLLVPQLVEAGTLLSVDLHPANGGAPRTMLACVVHVNTQANGQHALGCNFIRELSEEDLEVLV